MKLEFDRTELNKNKKSNGVRHKLPLEMWMLKSFEKAVFRPKERICALLYIIGFFWLLRGKEVRGLRREDVEFTEDFLSCTLALKDTKTNKIDIIYRTLKCCCKDPESHKYVISVCPVHAVCKLLPPLRRRTQP